MIIIGFRLKYIILLFFIGPIFFFSYFSYIGLIRCFLMILFYLSWLIVLVYFCRFYLYSSFKPHTQYIVVFALNNYLSKRSFQRKGKDFIHLLTYVLFLLLFIPLSRSRCLSYFILLLKEEGLPLNFL